MTQRQQQHQKQLNIMISISVTILHDLCRFYITGKYDGQLLFTLSRILYTADVHEIRFLK